MCKACVIDGKPAQRGTADVAVVIANNDSLKFMIQGMQASAQAILCRQQRDEPSSLYEAALFLAIEAEAKDQTSKLHLARVGLYAEEIARQKEMPLESRKLLLLACPLHDIGKLQVPESILCKPGSLDSEERRVMQEHCRQGVDLLGQLCESARGLPGLPEPFSDLARQLILTHHERFDGRGYPQGLAGEDIPIESRILVVADVFDALTTTRPYRAALDDDQALEVMMLEQGSRFDQEVFDAFLDCFDRIQRIRRCMHSEE